MIKLGVFTGARSEYGLMKGLLKALIEDPVIDISLIVGGLHFLDEFGNTFVEIKKDKIPVAKKLPFFVEGRSPSYTDFSDAIVKIADELKKQRYDALFIVGDRIESYAAALASHFTGTPIIHSGGGTLTFGAKDNIYRYNITNLAEIHLATSKDNYNRLIDLPMINRDNVYYTGSFAIDSIKKFKQNVTPIQNFVSGLVNKEYALITFHPATNSTEKLDDILIDSVKYIVSKGNQVLITYPNNDPGYESLVSAIKMLENWSDVYIVKSLGATGFYAALNSCRFVLGNSSSGIIEAPYFNKPAINVGTRQEGRGKDKGIIDVEAHPEAVIGELQRGYKNGWPEISGTEIYGDGSSVEKIIRIIKNHFNR